MASNLRLPKHQCHSSRLNRRRHVEEMDRALVRKKKKRRGKEEEKEEKSHDIFYVKKRAQVYVKD